MTAIILRYPDTAAKASRRKRNHQSHQDKTRALVPATMQDIARRIEERKNAKRHS